MVNMNEMPYDSLFLLKLVWLFILQGTRGCAKRKWGMGQIKE
jgi:hypothetical protein